MDGSHPFLPLLLSASLCQATSLHWLGGRPQALGLTVAVGGTNWDSASESFGLGDWSRVSAK